jgi:hypothetical protein
LSCTIPLRAISTFPPTSPTQYLAAVGRAVGLLPQDVKEEDVVTLNRLHRPTGCLLDARTNLSCLLVAPLSVSLALPERDSERLPGLAVAENHVSDVTSLVANAWMNDVSNNRGDIGDALGRRLQEKPPIRRLSQFVGLTPGPDDASHPKQRSPCSRSPAGTRIQHAAGARPVIPFEARYSLRRSVRLFTCAKRELGLSDPPG